MSRKKCWLIGHSGYHDTVCHFYLHFIHINIFCWDCDPSNKKEIQSVRNTRNKKKFQLKGWMKYKAGLRNSLFRFSIYNLQTVDLLQITICRRYSMSNVYRLPILVVPLIGKNIKQSYYCILSFFAHVLSEWFSFI